MRRSSASQGNLLSHLNAVYRPGDRDLAVELAEALGLTPVVMPITETFTLVAAHADGRDQDAVVNVVYLSEMAPGQAELESAIEEKAAADARLGEVLEAYRTQARERPDSSVHFGVLFPTDAALEPVLDKLRNQLSPALRQRVSVNELPAYGPVPGFPDIRQVFVYTDVFTAGSALLGQLIELQVERASH